LYCTVKVEAEEELRVACEVGRRLGLPLVYGEYAHHGSYHYYPADEPVRAWLTGGRLHPGGDGGRRRLPALPGAHVGAQEATRRWGVSGRSAPTGDIACTPGEGGRPPEPVRSYAWRAGAATLRSDRRNWQAPHMTAPSLNAMYADGCCFSEIRSTPSSPTTRNMRNMVSLSHATIVHPIPRPSE